MKKNTEITAIEWTATLLPANITEEDITWLCDLGAVVRPDPTRQGRWIIAGYTHNPWWGCTKWAAGCTNCYAEKFSKRTGRDVWGRGTPRWRTSEKNRSLPLKWNRISKQILERFGVRLNVFCGSMMDWLDSEVSPEWREDLFDVISQCDDLNWLMLTKRLEVKNWEPYETGIARLWDNLPPRWMGVEWPENVWFGHSVGCQDDWDTIKDSLTHLCATASPNIFISYGPAIGPVDWSAEINPIKHIFVEGESGAGAREFKWKWAVETLEWCRQEGVGFFMKQTGSNATWELWKDPIKAGPKGGNVDLWPEILPREYIS